MRARHHHLFTEVGFQPFARTRRSGPRCELGIAGVRVEQSAHGSAAQVRARERRARIPKMGFRDIVELGEPLLGEAGYDDVPLILELSDLRPPPRHRHDLAPLKYPNVSTAGVFPVLWRRSRPPLPATRVDCN